MDHEALWMGPEARVLLDNADEAQLTASCLAVVPVKLLHGNDEKEKLRDMCMSCESSKDLAKVREGLSSPMNEDATSMASLLIKCPEQSVCRSSYKPGRAISCFFPVVITVIVAGHIVQSVGSGTHALEDLHEPVLTYVQRDIYVTMHDKDLDRRQNGLVQTPGR